jgi:hypothetical protein
MGINPRDFQVSIHTIKERLGLSRYATVIPFGCEQQFDDHVLSILKKKFDAGSMLVRTRPDFLVIDEFESYYVEAKQKTKNVEAIQLLFNKFLERLGIKVIYSFPDVCIRAAMIPMDKIIVPANYRGYFDVNLKFIFEQDGISEFLYVGNVEKGSGDAFVAIDVDDLKMLSEELLVQGNS